MKLKIAKSFCVFVGDSQKLMLAKNPAVWYMHQYAVNESMQCQFCTLSSFLLHKAVCHEW